MPGTPVKIGPWTGGLNTYSEPTMIADTDAAEIINLDIDLDGSLVNRPPIGVMPSPTGVGGNVLGTYTTKAGITYFVIVDQAHMVRIYDVSSIGSVYSVGSIECSAVVQYQNKLWIVATTNSVNPGGSWDPIAGFVAIPTMARGQSAVIYKERLFIAAGDQATNSNRVNFSAPGNLSSWTPAVDFFDVNNGDGEDIIYIHSFQGYIVVFKTNSTYTFGYDSQPSKGQTQLTSSNIGIASINAFAEYENVLYIIYGNYLYSIQNWNWTQVNIKAPFDYYIFAPITAWSSFSCSVIGNKLVCRYYDNYYVYGLKTKTFSLWRFTKANFTPSHFVQYPILDPVLNKYMYVGGSYNSAETKWWKLIDTPLSVLSESFDISLVTKTYDYGVPYNFKRLHWWGVDILAKTQINFGVHPTVYNTPVTWSQLKAYTWSQLKTWARPVDIVLDVTDSASSTNPSGIRTFIKLLKSLRFRQISFKLSTTVDGTITTGPFRVFGMSAFTTSKELVSKKIS